MKGDCKQGVINRKGTASRGSKTHPRKSQGETNRILDDGGAPTSALRHAFNAPDTYNGTGVLFQQAPFLLVAKGGVLRSRIYYFSANLSLPFFSREQVLCTCVQICLTIMHGRRKFLNIFSCKNTKKKKTYDNAQLMFRSLIYKPAGRAKTKTKSSMYKQERHVQQRVPLFNKVIHVHIYVCRLCHTSSCRYICRSTVPFFFCFLRPAIMVN